MAKKPIPVRKKTHPDFFRDPKKAYRRRVYHTAATHPPSGQKIMGLAMALDRRNVIEIGSGHIPTSFFIRPEKLTLLDISSDNHERAKRYLEAERKKRKDLPKNKQMKFLLGDAGKGVPRTLKKQKFSSAMILEMLTHLPGSERTKMLDKWADHTDSFLIVDRHQEGKAPEEKERNIMPEYMNGEEIKAHLERKGFETLHYSTKTYWWPNAQGKNSPHTYYFLLSVKKH